MDPTTSSSELEQQQRDARRQQMEERRLQLEALGGARSTSPRANNSRRNLSSSQRSGLSGGNDSMTSPPTSPRRTIATGRTPRTSRRSSRQSRTSSGSATAGAGAATAAASDGLMRTGSRTERNNRRSSSGTLISTTPLSTTSTTSSSFTPSPSTPSSSISPMEVAKGFLWDEDDDTGLQPPGVTTTTVGGTTSLFRDDPNATTTTSSSKNTMINTTKEWVLQKSLSMKGGDANNNNGSSNRNLYNDADGRYKDDDDYDMEEYLPKSGNNISQRESKLKLIRTIRFYLLVIGFAAMFYLGVTTYRHTSPTKYTGIGSSSFTSSKERTEKILQELIKVGVLKKESIKNKNDLIGINAMNDTDTSSLTTTSSLSPQELAFLWLLSSHNEHLEVDGDDMDIIYWTIRYVLAVFYYTTGEQEYLSQEGWLSSIHCCEWHGLRCDLEEVTIHLQSIKLHGTIPWEIQYFQDLSILNLQDNYLTGTIPSTILESRENGAKLQIINLSENQFTGKLPFWEKENNILQEIYFNNNKLSESIDHGDTIRFLKNVRVLQLQNNQFNHKLPKELSQCTKLEEFKVEGNDLTGTIPSQYGTLTNLIHLNVRNNQFTGSMPIEICSLKVDFDNVDDSDSDSGAVAITETTSSSNSQQQQQLATLLADCDSNDFECNCCNECN